MRLVLASSSSRRADLLTILGVSFEVEPPEVDEARLPEENPQAFVERLARDKALAVVVPGAVVVGCDTAVAHEGRILGKPVHPEEARSMLRRIQGQSHEVFTGIAVATHEGPAPVVHSAVDATEVTFLPMTEEEIVEYVASGEPMDKAGGYALQGRGGLFVESVSGSPFTVIGMPLHLLPRLLGRHGLDLGTFRVAG